MTQDQKAKEREIKIKISEREMDAIEDAFFSDIEESQMRLLRRVWKKLCEQMDKK